MTFDGVRAVLFDAVGTLIRPEPSVAEAYHAIGVRHGSRLAIDEIRSRFRAVFEGEDRASPKPTSRAIERARWGRIVATVFDDVPDAGGDLFEELWRWFADPERWRPFDDAAAVLPRLIGRDLIVGVASNFDERLEAIVARWFPTLSRSYVFHSADVGWPKPHARFYGTIQAALGLTPSELLLVGDHEINDAAAPIACGWKARWLDRGGSGGAGTIRSLGDLA